MTERVDFYVLKSSTPRPRWAFACRLTEKAYLLNLKVVVWSETAAEADAMDEMLWTFDDRSFVPHDVRRGGQPDTAPLATTTGAAAVQLTPDLESVAGADLLVNLSSRLPGGLERFHRVAEIIDADAERRANGRSRFKTYRDDLKLTVETHQWDGGAGA